MKKYRYTKIPLKYISKEIMDEYNIQALESKGFVHFEMRKGMYELKESGIIVFNHLVENFTPTATTRVNIHLGFGLILHDKLCLPSLLMIFGIKYFKCEDALYLFNARRNNYTITTD